MNQQQLTFVEVLQVVEKKSGVNFSYNSELLQSDIRINVNVNNRPIKDILNEMFRETDIKYQELNDQVVIFRTRRDEIVLNHKEQIINVSDYKKPEVQTEKAPIEDSANIQPRTPKINPLLSRKANAVDNSNKDYIETKKTAQYQAKRTYYDNMKYIPFYKKLYYDIELHTQMEYPLFRSINPTQTIYSDYVDLYKNNTRDRLGFNFGGRLDVYYKDYFVKTGLNVSLRREEYVHKYTNTEVTWRDSLYNTYETIQLTKYDGYWELLGNDSNWVPTTYFVDSVITYENSKTIYDTTENYIKNEYRNRTAYFEIPLLFGYNKKLTHKLNLNISGGFIASFLIYEKGKLPAFSDYTDIIVTERKHYLSTGFAIVVNPSLQYRLSRQLSLMAEPAFRFNLRSVYNKDFPVEKKLIYGGLNIGLVYKL
ncbi:MAG: STN domain-containing protein [Bacteroidales bacterium]|nr:STN domain-containing protein [Bacteroidales bacterium]